MERSELAQQYFEQGYNCAQAVALAFEDLLPVDKNNLAKLCSPFGGGMGRMRHVCGALSGSFVVYGLLNGYDGPETGNMKKDLYSQIQEIANEFKKQNGSIICSELLGLNKGENNSPVPTPRTSEFFQKRPCKEIVKLTAQILENKLNN